MSYTYKYPRPSLTVDCIVFGLKEGVLKVLLIQRGHPPFEGKWALPGGFVDLGEDLEAAALRELEEETGVKNLFIEQLFTFGSVARDPRGRVISVAYFALVNLDEHPVKAASDAKEAAWYNLDELPDLAFDHDEILALAKKRLRSKVLYQPIGFELLPKQFTLSALQQLYETILGLSLNKRNFRTKMQKMGLLKACGTQTNVSHRPATLYEFDAEKYKELSSGNFHFEINYPSNN